MLYVIGSSLALLALMGATGVIVASFARYWGPMIDALGTVRMDGMHTLPAQPLTERRAQTRQVREARLAA